ncbi:MAG: diguanylate cyclase [Pseudomonadota bacterium]|nr:diguanylate cyclase [Pseudomonadota bacterium]MDP1906057.1 diguanylate cyclase [Pseudomonadota bacterium]MDP2352527.1 diguanylate cyclase [Pseudomonadota bacterium]
MKKTAFIIEGSDHTLERINEILGEAGITARFMPCGLEHARAHFSGPVDCVKLAHKANELEHAHERLKWSEARMRHFARIAADWFWETDEDHQIIWSSDGPIREGDRLSDAFSGGLPGLLPVDHDMEALASLKEGRPFQEAVLEVELESGERAAFRLSGEPLFDSNGHFAGYRGVGHDITEALQISRQISHEANHDTLTGLANRREFQRRMQRAWLRSRQEGAVHALCFLDLDRFKAVNDHAGHAAGDALLTQLATVMRGHVRGADTLARLGGDEFCVLLENCALEYAIRVSDNLISTLRELEFEWQGQRYSVGASVGITLITPQTEDATRALAEADVACYAAKKLGRNQVQVYHAAESGGQVVGG